ncbi:unnamed protein product [Calypogeia fissa]
MNAVWGGLTLSLILINLAAIMERADESLLPAVYKEVGQAFNASPSELGSLTFIRSLVQAMSSPLAGLLAMRYHRPSVIGIGTLFWGLSTAAVAVSQTFFQCAVSRAINGVGLAIVIPALQSFTADSYLEGTRGVAFGWLNLVGSMGAIGGTMMATIMAGNTYGGLPGWRVAFLVMAVVSSLIGWLVHTLVSDPRTLGIARSASGRQLISERLEEEKVVKNLQTAWRDSWIAVKAVMKVRTFQIIVLQGLVGSLPWTAMVFFTMWLQLVGFGHGGAASLMGIFAGGCAVGALFGGWMGDTAEKMYPGFGRIYCAQFSSFMGIPFSYFLLLCLPQDPAYYLSYAATMLLMGLTISWCQACANNPMFADVVPEQNRTMVYAFDRAFEGSWGAMAAPMVGLLAENVFGYRADQVILESGSVTEARALSRGLFTVMAVPFGLCCFCYTFLYGTYKRDRDYAHAQARWRQTRFDESDEESTGNAYL